MKWICSLVQRKERNRQERQCFTRRESERMVPLRVNIGAPENSFFPWFFYCLYPWRYLGGLPGAEVGSNEIKGGFFFLISK